MVSASPSSSKIRYSFLSFLGPWSWFLSFILLNLGLLFSAPKLLNIAFPMSSFALGLHLYFYNPISYLGFTWWIWFATPLIRRLSDYFGGFTNQSPILLSPFLVTLVSVITFFKYWPRTARHGGLPFGLAFFGIFYGMIIGFINAPMQSVLIESLEWFAPVIFGFHIYCNWQSYPDYRQAIRKIFLWCVLLSGIYGVYQFLVAPPWDTYWLSSLIAYSKGNSFGQPEPLGIRVWSTMHGPEVFGGVMMAGLLLLLNEFGPLVVPATVFGYLAFLLSMLRSGWFGWMVGVSVLFSSLKLQSQVRLIIFVILGCLLLVPLVQVEPFSDVITPRLESLLDLESDGSRSERIENYDRALGYALTNPIGDGIAGNSRGLLDSAILDTLLSLGHIGTLLYAPSLLSLIFVATKSSKKLMDPFQASAYAITVGMVARMFLGSVMLGLQGMILWGFASILLAADKYYSRKDDTHMAQANANKIYNIG